MAKKNLGQDQTVLPVGEVVIYPASGVAKPHMPVPGVVQVRVLVAHDGLHAGKEYQMIMGERTEALIRCGYLEVVIPTGNPAPWASW
jgi:hypothetical protein